VEAAWRVVDPALTAALPGAGVRNPATWGPGASKDVVNDGDTWHDPVIEKVLAVLNAGEVIFLLDVDNTLLDNDRFAGGSRATGWIRRSAAPERALYWEIFAAAARADGACRLLGKLCMAFRTGLDDHPDLLAMSEFLLEYPFGARLFPRALEAVAHLNTIGRPVVLSDGDIVFQPRKIQRSGNLGCGRGRVMIYVHKERVLDHVQQRYPGPALCSWSTTSRISLASHEIGARG